MVPVEVMGLGVRIIPLGAGAWERLVIPPEPV